MPRRRKAQSAISLFAFQDIITSVTAIVILIMLILCVDFTQKQRAAAAATPASTIKQLEKHVRDLEQLESQLSSQLHSALDTPTSLTAPVLIDQLHTLETQRSQLTDRLEETRNTHTRVTHLLTEANERSTTVDSQVDMAKILLQQINDLSQENEKISKANTEETKRIEQRKLETSQLRRDSTELIYNPVNDGTTQWLVEISVDGVVAMKLGGAQPLALGHSLGNGRPLRHWLDNLSSSTDYCLILRRPSADIKLALDVEEEMQNRAIQHGLDLVGEEQVIRDGSREL